MTGGAYRSNADPEKDEQLYTVGIAGGEREKRTFMTFVFVCGGLCFLTSFLFAFQEVEMGFYSTGVNVVLLAIAIAVIQKRRRRLTIIRHGDKVRLEITPNHEATLHFPIDVRGAIGTRNETKELRLQLIDRDKKSITVGEIYGSSRAQVGLWDWDDRLDDAIDSPRYDVGYGLLGKLRSEITKVSKEHA